MTKKLTLIQPDYNKKQVIQNLIEEKHYSTSYESWYSAALQLDSLNPETVRWKLDKESTLYDYKLIEENLDNLRNARNNKDYDTLLYLIRTTWERNLGNMGDLNLYRHSHVGTKKLIEDYLEECILSINELLHESHIDDRILLNIFMQTRKKVGRTALVLSGGGTFGLFHIGVLATLYEHDLLPKVISGSSAGAIVASILCIHKKEEIIGLLEEVLSKSFNIFQDDSEKSESENLLIKVSRFLQNGTWFDNRHLVNTMIGFLGDLTFREAYNKTGKILNVTVSPASVYEQPRLLNNLTAPNVLIWSAVCASCSLPGIFPSTPLYEKDPNTGETKEWNSSSVKFMDGSVDNDLPISRLSEMFNVDHIIACQVNVHVFPFLKLSISCVGGEIEDEISARFKTKLNQISSFCVNEVVHLLEMGTELGIATNLLTKLRSVFLQQYSGDITILPDLKMLLSFNKMLKNPTQNFLLEETIEGARATWPKMSIIKNHCAQEFELDKAITYLKTQIISNSKGADLITSELPIMGTPLLTGSDHPLHNALNEILSEEEEQLSRESSLSPTLMETLGQQHVLSPFVPETGFTSPRREHSISLTYTPTGLSNVVNRKRTETISVLCNPNDVVVSPANEQKTIPASLSDTNPPLKTPPGKKKQKKNKKRRSRK
ncbi:related to Lipase 5 [Saccharomycodes ludwigii]|uniref:Related to Lipase 5 n=1 Tax=Saccharomycodes ludwigii TaxID=36035 RepID=A0A376B8J3_9ASCO|nr:related to Lipase 5 [Saccharomycodes ludwigii]